MNILNIQNSIDFDSMRELSNFLLEKNGYNFQNLINVEENSELIIELLKTRKNKSAISSEIADVFITMQHVITSFNIEEKVNSLVISKNKIRVNTYKLCSSLAQLIKGLAKNINRCKENVDDIINFLVIVRIGLLQYIKENNIVDSVNNNIAKKIKRTKKRNNFSEFSLETANKKDWDEIFLIMAFAMASGSHCVSRQVGTLLVKNKRIISTGINGTPEGCQNCDDLFPKKNSPLFNREEHHKFSLDNEIHAEMNALLFKSKEGGGYNLQGSTIYCTVQPCNECIKNILQSGVKRVVYAESYDLSSYSDFIKDAIKKKKIELVHKPIANTSKAFVFIQNSMIKTIR